MASPWKALTSPVGGRRIQQPGDMRTLRSKTRKYPDARTDEREHTKPDLRGGRHRRLRETYGVARATQPYELGVGSGPTIRMSAAMLSAILPADSCTESRARCA